MSQIGYHTSLGVGGHINCKVRKYNHMYNNQRSRHHGSNMSGMCIWGIKLGDDNKVADTEDQLIHMRLFLEVNI